MRVQVLFSGRVQGVGFRATARSIASHYPITGWVRNEPDSAVRLEAQGDPAQIDAFLHDLGVAMQRNIVTSVRAEMQEIRTESAFHILR